jgi:hypothetical protein
MRYKKFLLIPALLFFYLFFVVDMLLSFSPITISGTESAPSGGGVQIIGVGEGVSVSVTRPYFFGLISLPVYTSGLGNIGAYHDAFFWLLGLLTVAFVVIEWRDSVAEKKSYGMPRMKTVYALEETKMAKTTFGGTSWMSRLKALGVGVAFGVVAWFIATLLGDTGAITAAALLVMYLEYKMK